MKLFPPFKAGSEMALPSLSKMSYLVGQEARKELQAVAKTVEKPYDYKVLYSSL